MGHERLFLGSLQLLITQKRLKGRIKIKNKSKSLVSSLSYFYERSEEKLKIHPWMSIISLFSEVKFAGVNPY
jgi:hypothetical protein